MNLEDVKTGMKVCTHKVLGETKGMFVKPKHLKARRPDSEGVVLDYIPGHGGDCWWVKHGDAPDGSEIGAYCFDEFEPIQEGE